MSETTSPRDICRWAGFDYDFYCNRRVVLDSERPAATTADSGVVAVTTSTVNDGSGSTATGSSGSAVSRRLAVAVRHRNADPRRTTKPAEPDAAGILYNKNHVQSLYSKPRTTTTGTGNSRDS